MKKLYIFANEVKPDFRDISVAVVMYYCAVFERELRKLASDASLVFLSWSARSDEIGEVYRYDGPSKKKLYALIDIIDNKLIDDNFATVVLDYWKCNYEEFIRQTNEVVWSDYGCEKPNKKTFIKKLNRENVSEILNSIIVNLVEE